LHFFRASEFLKFMAFYWVLCSFRLKMAFVQPKSQEERPLQELQVRLAIIVVPARVLASV
jgi:hypothetical protein